jgi:hypothetical protein
MANKTPYSITPFIAGPAGTVQWRMSDGFSRAETREQALQYAEDYLKNNQEYCSVQISFKPFKTKPGTETWVSRKDA